MKIIKIPSNQGGLEKKKGVELAPSIIYEHVKDFYLKESGLLPVLTTEDVEIKKNNIEETNAVIQNLVSNLDSPAILIGGDHSITYPAFRGISSHKNPGIIIFDAHPDCENNFSPPTHEDFLRTLIEEGSVKKDNVVLVGIRNMHSNEEQFLKKNRIKVFSMNEIARESVHEVCDAIMSVARRFEPLYVSVDIDVIDPAFAPGTGYTEPGGLTSREILYMLQRIRMLKNFRILDIVEVNPEKDVNDLTVKLAAKIVVEMS